MPPTRQEYNAKARRSTAGTRKKRMLKRRKTDGQADDTNPNAEIIVPKSVQGKELDKKKRMREEVCKLVLRALSTSYST
jgi:ATP-dependent RNA helicase DHX37/DHR1